MPISLNILSKFDAKGIGQAQTGLDKLGKAAGGFAAAGVAAFAVAAAGAAAFGYQALRAAAESESVSKSLQQIAKNSGVFGDTAAAVQKSTKEIMDYTQSLSNLVGIDDEILNSIVRGWLAVPELAGKGVDGLKDLVKVVADVAAGTGRDVAAVGMIFTRVAGDEETAMSKLTRAGIVLSDAQKQIYADTLATSGEIAAQDKLIEILGTTYAGAAEAAADPFAVLEQNIQNLQETVGVHLLDAFNKFVEKLQEFIAKHGPDLEKAFEKVGEFAMGLVEAFFDFSGWVADNPNIWNGIVAGIGAITAAMLVLNGVMAANPIGLVMLGIAAIIAGTVFIVANWNKVIASWVGGFQVLFGATLISVEGFVNGIIDGINTVIGLLNNLGIAIGEVGKVDFGGNAVVAQGINRMDTQGLGNPTGQRLPSGYANSAFANMPRFAAGGIVTGPMVGLVGEAGPEAIIPLDRLGKMGGGTTNHYTINVSAMNADARVGELVVSAIKRYERSNGPVFVSA
jgi:hypothetical protein